MVKAYSKMKIILLLLITLNIQARSLSNPRTVFVQLFEWTWRDIERECVTNLGPNGFSAVQISPPHEHLVWENSPWWERYQVVSYDLISRSGNEEELKSMIETCKSVGVDIYADVIVNHMAGMRDGVGFNGTTFNQYEYGDYYSYEDFHHCGKNGNDDIKDYHDLYELQNCELVNLADLDTSSTHVQQTLAKYLNKLIDLGINGLRLDAAKHIAAHEINAFLKLLKKPVYIVQELITSSSNPFDVNDYIKNGDVSAYAYPYIVGNAFKNKAFSLLNDFTKYMPNSIDSVVFLDNHDLQRSEDRSMLLSANYDGVEFDLAQIFMLTYPFGYPQIYSSYHFNNYDDGPPVDQNLFTKDILDSENNCTAPFICEHRFSYVNNLVKFRNKTNDKFYITNWTTNNIDQLSFGRDNLGHVIINNSNFIMSGKIQTNMNPGQYCNLVKNNYCEIVNVNADKTINLHLKSKSALVILK